MAGSSIAAVVKMSSCSRGGWHSTDKSDMVDSDEVFRYSSCDELLFANGEWLGDSLATMLSCTEGSGANSELLSDAIDKLSSAEGSGNGGVAARMLSCADLSGVKLAC